MNDNQENDPLQSLLMDDASSVNRERLASFLRPFVVFDKSSKAANFLPGFQLLPTNTAKVEVLLLAAKARSLLFGEKEGLTPGEIIDLGIMAPGSVKSSLKNLYDSSKIRKENGRYSLPPYRITGVMESNRGKVEEDTPNGKA
jgi:hypothetical protein